VVKKLERHEIAWFRICIGSLFEWRVVKKLERLEMAWLIVGFCPGSLFEWASPTQKERLQSCSNEVID
jgi:hypothetical protein